MTLSRASTQRKFRLLALMLALFAAGAGEARALPDQLDEGAADRAARHVAAKEGRLELPLPGTPDTDDLLGRLASMGLSLGSPVLMRAFKMESELEIWIRKDGSYVRFATYPICYWSGVLGPKMREGDKQTPEGFYAITAEQLHHGSRWPRSLDIGYPNVFDRALGRYGSHILVHGGCSSVGCLAMGNAVNDEVYDLVSAALQSPMHRVSAVPVQVFPFRMSAENLAAQASEPWGDFWRNLKEGYDSFERTQLPPRVSVCEGKYRVEDGTPGSDDGAGSAITSCDGGPVVAAAPAIAPPGVVTTPQAAPAPVAANAPVTQPQTSAAIKKPAIKCALGLPSCRRWVALRNNRAMGRVASSQANSRGRSGKRTRVR